MITKLHEDTLNAIQMLVLRCDKQDVKARLAQAPVADQAAIKASEKAAIECCNKILEDLHNQQYSEVVVYDYPAIFTPVKQMGIHLVLMELSNKKVHLSESSYKLHGDRFIVREASSTPL